ncbi:PucR family transcriptional regulator [Cryptosporangium minutisporangium]|uniref:PucR family transcriptional regulator n=1 Tax=Cryptosporangium minutisporangium TaxID=113569 RepID=UPI0031F1B090
MGGNWPVPSTRVRELIRRGAEIALHPPGAWIEELYAAALGGERMRAIAEDPVLSEGARRTNVANVLHWAAANLQRPGERVPANVSAEVLEIARDLVRRGLDERALDSYRTAQNVAWRHWMEICFELTDDPAELRELLDVSSRSIGTFLDDTVTALTVRMQAEREELTRGTHAERRAAVTLLLEGAPISRSRAEDQLGYRLGGPHVAAIVWSSTGTPMSELEDTAEAVRKAGGASRRLTVLAGAGTVWIWLPTADAPPTEALQAHLPGSADVRVAVGRPGRDLEGFRRSHLDALTTQRMLARLTSPRRIARFEDVQLVAALTADPTQADEFVAETLGELAAAEPELRDTLVTYLREQCNSSRTAERLFTHRNTVLRRLARADDLLPRPLAQNTIAVAAALEVLHWRGRAG